MKLNYQLFFSLGIHIGNYKFNLKHYYKSFLIGYINHFCIFDLSKILFFFKKALFFFIFLGKSNGKFLFYNHDFSNLGKFFQFFFYNWLNETNNFFLDEIWSYGMLSNLYTSSYVLFNDLFSFKEGWRNDKTFFFYKKIDFYKFFFNLLFFSVYRKISGEKWSIHFLRMKKYWRFFLFFKFYKYLNRFPDAFLYFSSYNFPTPALEMNSLYIPVVSNLDSNFSYYNYVSYPLFGNSKSFFIYLFYFLFFMNSYLKGKTFQFYSLKFNHKFF